MRIAVQARDLDHNRIDGTRVYLKQLLQRFGDKSPETNFTLYHRDIFNPRLAPPAKENYTEKRLPGRLAWMQTAFALEMFRTRPEKIFLPLQAAPLFAPRKSEITATIHDLAFRFYPETFPNWDRFKLRVFLRILLWRAKKIICVSHATKRDLLHFFPRLAPERVKVIHHGFDGEFFATRPAENETKKVLENYNLQSNQYLLYIGALQPRKNIIRIIEAYEILRKAHNQYRDYKLVLAGEAAWLSGEILARVEASPLHEDIVLTGGIGFEEVRVFYQEAALFVFPSLYEGFGLPILEAFAAGTPVLVSENSSLREVAGDGAWYCDAFSSEDIAEQIACMLTHATLRERLATHARGQLQKFSWDKAAEETLEYIQADI